MPTLQDLVDEVQTLSHELSQRVDTADKEQKARGEELTSKVGTMAAEYKSSTDALNSRINELTAQIDAERIAAARPPLSGGAGSKRRNGPARDAMAKALKGRVSSSFFEAQHEAFMKAVRARGDISVLSAEERALICRDFMPAEQKALYAGDATTGGFFASTDFVDELIQYRLLISPMRAICRQMTTGGEKVQMPSLANDTTVFWATEQANFNNSQDPTVAMLNIPVHELRGLLKVSQQNIEDSMFNLEDLIKERLTKNFAKIEGAAFVAGTGAGQPRGLLNYPTQATSSFPGGSAGKNNPTNVIATVQSAAAVGKINADDVLNVLMDLKADYRNSPTTAYIFTASTLNTIRLFKDAQARPLWQPFGGSNLPSTIYDKKYVEMPDMPEIATGTLPIAVGDFDNYLIVDRITLNIQQLNELFIASGLIGFIARLRVGGDILLPESFRLLKVN